MMRVQYISEGSPMKFDQLTLNEQIILRNLAANVCRYSIEHPDSEHSLLGFNYGKEKNKFFAEQFLYKDPQSQQALDLISQMVAIRNAAQQEGLVNADLEELLETKTDRDLSPLNLDPFESIADLRLAIVEFEREKTGTRFHQQVIKPFLQSTQKYRKQENFDPLDIAGELARTKERLKEIEKENKRLKSVQTQLEQTQRNLQEKTEKSEDLARQLATEKVARIKESSHLKQRLEPLEAESSRLHGENSALRAEVTELRQSNSSQAAALTDAKDELAREQSKSQGLETKKASLTAKVADLTGQLGLSREDLQQRQTQLSELRQTLETESASHTEKVASLSKDNQALAKKSSHLHRDNKALQTRVEELTRTQAASQARIQDLEQQLGDAKAATGQATVESARLQQKLTTSDRTITALKQQLTLAQEEVRQAKASLPSRKDLEKQRAIIDLMPRLREGDARHLKSNLYSVVSDKLERGEAFDKELFPKLIAAFTTNTGNWVSWRDNSTTAGQLLDGLKENLDLADYLGVKVDKKTKQKDLRTKLGTQNDEFKKLKSKDEHLVFFKLSTIEKNHQASQHITVEPRA